MLPFRRNDVVSLVVITMIMEQMAAPHPQDVWAVTLTQWNKDGLVLHCCCYWIKFGPPSLLPCKKFLNFDFDLLNSVQSTEFIPTMAKFDDEDRTKAQSQNVHNLIASLHEKLSDRCNSQQVAEIVQSLHSLSQNLTGKSKHQPSELRPELTAMLENLTNFVRMAKLSKASKMTMCGSAMASETCQGHDSNKELQNSRRDDLDETDDSEKEDQNNDQCYTNGDSQDLTIDCAAENNWYHDDINTDAMMFGFTESNATDDCDCNSSNISECLLDSSDSHGVTDGNEAGTGSSKGEQTSQQETSTSSGMANTAGQGVGSGSGTALETGESQDDGDGEKEKKRPKDSRIGGCANSEVSEADKKKDRKRKINLPESDLNNSNGTKRQRSLSLSSNLTNNPGTPQDASFSGFSQQNNVPMPATTSSLGNPTSKPGQAPNENIEEMQLDHSGDFQNEAQLFDNQLLDVSLRRQADMLPASPKEFFDPRASHNDFAVVDGQDHDLDNIPGTSQGNTRREDHRAAFPSRPPPSIDTGQRDGTQVPLPPEAFSTKPSTLPHCQAFSWDISGNLHPEGDARTPPPLSHLEADGASRDDLDFGQCPAQEAPPPQGLQHVARPLDEQRIGQHEYYGREVDVQTGQVIQRDEDRINRTFESPEGYYGLLFYHCFFCVRPYHVSQVPTNALLCDDCGRFFCPNDARRHICVQRWFVNEPVVNRDDRDDDDDADHNASSPQQNGDEDDQVAAGDQDPVADNDGQQDADGNATNEQPDDGEEEQQQEAAGNHNANSEDQGASGMVLDRDNATDTEDDGGGPDQSCHRRSSAI